MKQVMKKLCVLLALMTLSVGAWADGDGYWLSTDTYHNNQSDYQKVVKIHLSVAGKLADAIAEVKSSATYSDCQYVYINNNSTNGNDEMANDADIAALQNLECKTINLMDFYYVPTDETNRTKENAKAFTFSNSTVEYVTFPDGWTKDEVNACAETLKNSNFKGCISTEKKSDGYGSIVAYVNQPLAMLEIMKHSATDTKAHNNYGGSTTQCGNLKYLTVSGYPSAGDLTCGWSALNCDENGHLIYNEPAGEFVALGAGVSGNTRTLIGTNSYGPTFNAASGLFEIDLSGVTVEDRWNEDFCLAKIPYLVGDPTYKVVLPTYSGFNTIPADFLNVKCAVQSIMIPSNILTIKTRAFSTGGNACLNHVWTEGSDETVVYDNGAITAVDSETGEETKVYGEDAYQASMIYGTFTLGPNIKKIESYAFSKSEQVKDLYVLSIQAPECHVDAFNTVMYVANNTCDNSKVSSEGMITREAYYVGSNKWMTMLHYPRECVTPDIQRYTDVTREYSVATADRDGKGGIIYYPNQSEFVRAYRQGTNGYLWKAWDPTRADYTNGFLKVSSGEGALVLTSNKANNQSNNTHTVSQQENANEAYTSNTNLLDDKTDRSFYDVTENGATLQPSGLNYYYNTVWEGVHLYPKNDVVMEDVYVADENGEYYYSNGQYTTSGTGTRYSKVQGYVPSSNSDDYVVDNTFGNYYKVRSYTENNESGEYVKEVVATENSTGQYVEDYSYNTANYEEGSGKTYWFYDSGYQSANWNYEMRNTLYTNNHMEEVDSEYTGTKYILDENHWSGHAVYRTYHTWESIPAGTKLYGLITDGTYTLYDSKYSELTGVINWYTYYDNGFTSLSDADAASKDEAGIQLYTKDYTGTYRKSTSADEDEQKYDVTVNAREYNAATDEGMTRYDGTDGFVTITNYNNAALGTYTLLDENKYGVEYVQSDYQIEMNHDYRGWHQFVLTAYATNSNEPFTPYRSYITDNDWWTICLPFDLTKADLIKLFGKNGSDADADMPYLSKLTYVVRDVENKRIVLTFSKNLMKYKEEVDEGKVHGNIDETKSVELDDVVLHKGVPYLIRPNLTTDGKGNVTGTRQFDIYNEAGTRDAALYARIVGSQELSSSELNTLIYNGIYTVPAYVINNDGSESVSSESSVSFTNADNSTFTYTTSDEISYQGKSLTGSISSDYCYSFVGSFFLSLMPKYSYFLGWDSEKNKAAFWYNKVNDIRNYTWNNNTGIIMPNFVTSNQRIKDIKAGTSLADPARWEITLKNGDDFASTSSVKNYTNDSQFGFAAPMWKDDATMIIRIDDDSVEQPVNGVKGVFNMNGQFMGNSTDGLQRGIYVVNGKKMVIK